MRSFLFPLRCSRYALTHVRNRLNHLRADFISSSATAGSALVCGGAQQTFLYVSFMDPNLSYVNLNDSLLAGVAQHAVILGLRMRITCTRLKLRIKLAAAFMKCCCLALVLLLGLLWCVVEIHSQQTFPYVSFMGQTLANHSYVNLSLVGRYDNNTVQCHTDLVTCCSAVQGSYRGDWYFPNGDSLPIYGVIYERRQSQKVILNCGSTTPSSGIYRCNIPTDAVHDNDLRETVYVGLYASGGIANGHSK